MNEKAINTLSTQTQEGNLTPADPNTEYLGFSVEIRPKAVYKQEIIQ